MNAEYGIIKLRDILNVRRELCPNGEVSPVNADFISQWLGANFKNINQLSNSDLLILPGSKAPTELQVIQMIISDLTEQQLAMRDEELFEIIMESYLIAKNESHKDSGTFSVFIKNVSADKVDLYNLLYNSTFILDKLVYLYILGRYKHILFSAKIDYINQFITDEMRNNYSDQYSNKQFHELLHGRFMDSINSDNPITNFQLEFSNFPNTIPTRYIKDAKSGDSIDLLYKTPEEVTNMLQSENTTTGIVAPIGIDDSEAAKDILAKGLEGDELNVRVHPKVIMAADIGQLADQTTKEFEARHPTCDAPTGSTMHYKHHGKPQELAVLRKILTFKESILAELTKGSIDIDTYVKIVNNSLHAIEDELKFVPDRLGKEGSLELRLINSIRGGLECDKKSLAVILDKLISVTNSFIKNAHTGVNPTEEQIKPLDLANLAYEVYCIVDPDDYKEPNKEKDTKPDTNTEILPESGRVKPANTPMSKHEVLTRLSVMQEQLITANQAITNLVANTLQELDAKIADIKRDLLN